MSDEHDATSPGPDAPVASGPVLMLVRVGGWFGIPAHAVREVAIKGAVTRVPGAPRDVLGIASLRGAVVPVVSLDPLVGCGGQTVRAPATTLPRLVIVQASDYEVALVVDEIRGIIDAGSSVISCDVQGDRPTFMREQMVWNDETITLLDVPALITAAMGPAEGSA
jgi:purine-binding chemotaxis protein CheW